MRKILKLYISLLTVLFPATALFSQSTSLDFDGINDFVHINPTTSLDLGTTGTIEVWIKVDTFNDNAGIIHRGDRSDFADEAYSLQFGAGTNKQKIVLYLTDATGSSNTLTSSTSLVANKWYHIAATWNSGNIYLYINGTQDATMARTRTPRSSTGGLNIGCQINSSSYYPFNGKIDEVRIWNVTRSQTNLRDKMYIQLDGTETGLVGYWDFEEGTGFKIQSPISQSVSGIVLTNNGSYTTQPSITLSGGGGAGASAGASMGLVSASIVNGGSGYKVNDVLTIQGGTLSQTAKLNVTSTTGSPGKVITGVSINRAGNYTAIPSNPASVSGSGGATFNLTWNILSVNVTSSGSGYYSCPSVSFSSGSATAYSLLTLTGLFYNGSSQAAGPIWKTENAPLYHEWLGTNSTAWSTTSNWFGGWLPYNLIPVKISSSASNNCILAADADVEKLLIETGKTLTINPSYTLKANGATQINGSLVLDANSTNSGGFIDNGTINYSSGTVTAKRILANNKWHYLSSPVNSSTANVLWGCAVYRYYEPDGASSTAWKPIVAGNTLNNMQGYDVYVKNTDKTVNFTGTLNTGTFINSSMTRSTDGYNFVGNPYPSPIDWDASSGITRNHVDNAIYIWDPSTGNFMSYVNGTGTNGGSRYIPSTQGFFVKVSSGFTTGSLSIGNASRISNSVAYRQLSNNPEVRLVVKSTGFKDETVIRFNSDASNAFDDQFDANKIFLGSPNGTLLYTSDGVNDYSINTLNERNEIKETKIPLNLKVFSQETDTISLVESNSSAPGYDIYLEDLLTGTVVNMKVVKNYIFQANFNDNQRFNLFFVPITRINSDFKTDSTFISSVDQNSKGAEPKIISDENTIIVDLKDKNIDQNTRLEVYNLNGQNLGTYSLTSSLSKVELPQMQGVFLAKVINGNEITSVKIVLGL